MHAKPLHLPPGADIRRSLEQLAQAENSAGFVLSVVGNLSQASFACPGRNQPTVLRGELEIITLQGTIAPDGVHLHLSFSDENCQVWGGHLEQGSVVLKGADLLVGLLPALGSSAPVQTQSPGSQQQPRVQVALAEGCPWSARAERMLRSLGITYARIDPAAGRVPQVFIDGELIGGYSELAELHGNGGLEGLRHG